MFQRTRAIRKLHGRPSEGPHALMRGTLTVSDASGVRTSCGERHRATQGLRLRHALCCGRLSSVGRPIRESRRELHFNN